MCPPNSHHLKKEKKSLQEPFAGARWGCAQKEGKKIALTSLLAALSYSPLWAKQFDTGFCSQPGSAGFLTHPEQKAIPLTKYLAQIFVKIEWTVARELSSNHDVNISSPGH